MTEETTDPGPGIIYTETTIFSPPEAYAADAPYQIAIVSLEKGGRLTARIAGAPVAINDAVRFVEHRNGAAIFEKAG